MQPESPLPAIASALESYLCDTRRIDPLARRQAHLICRVFDNQAHRGEAMMVVLLALAALRKGSPRADKRVLLEPLASRTMAAHSLLYRQESGSDAHWAEISDTMFSSAAEAIGKFLADPSWFAPVSGAQPVDFRERWPLLVADSKSIGFSRYWAAVRQLETQLLPGRLRQALDDPDGARVADALNHVFIDKSILSPEGRFHERQVAAAALACRSRFLVISGGPGTGKTSVVIQLLRTLLQVFPDINAERIVLCAPTGRAKARLGESLDSGIDALTGRYGDDGSRLAEQLRPIGRKTLHGLLGMRPDGSFRHTADRQLPCQVVVVDEASMVDIHLFAALIKALPPTCRLVLVGDMHQLPPVEAGALLGDLTERFAGTNGATLSSGIGEWISGFTRAMDVDPDIVGQSMVCKTTGECSAGGLLLDRTILLSHSYRARGVQLPDLAREINRGAVDAALGLLDRHHAGTAVLDERNGVGPVEAWLQACFSGEHFAQVRHLDGCVIAEGGGPAAEATRVITRVLGAATILTLSHEGRRGRIAINALAVARLREMWGGNFGHRFFHGLPVVLGANHHELDLYNGDLGMIIRTRDHGLRVFFPRRSGCIVTAVDRLTDLDVAFALTVHKSQGSEFDEVMLVLPEHVTSLLSRQIVYTAITRARHTVTILGTREILEKAIRTREDRPGGVCLG